MDTTAKQAIGTNQEQWLQALESGEYQQNPTYLSNRGRHCCLGVACKVFGVPVRVVREETGAEDFEGESDQHTVIPPHKIVTTLALNDNGGGLTGATDNSDSLMTRNDRGDTFAEIAAFCRAHPEAVFTEPR